MSYENYPAPAEMNPSDQRLWATLIHIGSIFLGFLAPLFGYIILKDRGAFARAHTATSLNFQLTMLIAVIVGSFLTAVLIGYLVLLAVAVANVVFPILAAVAANRGAFYRYPLAFNFVR
jgi:uncharacterized Tic20 family protein